MPRGGRNAPALLAALVVVLALAPPGTAAQQVYYKGIFDSRTLRSEDTNRYNGVRNQPGVDRYDLAGYNNCGRAYGPVKLTVGRALLSGNSRPNDLPNGDNPWTLSFYVYVQDAGPRDAFVHFGTCTARTAAESVTVGMDRAAGGRFKLVVNLHVLPGQTTTRYVINGNDLARRKWHRIVITYSGQGRMLVYINPGRIQPNAPTVDLTARLRGRRLQLPSTGGSLSFGTMPTCTTQFSGEFYLDNVFLLGGVVTDINSLSVCDYPTDMPPTPVPPTPVPPTPVPATPVPPTPVPPTPVPATPVPSTPAPPTPVPPTPVPPTPVPATPVPSTPAPPTPVPPTPVPSTPVPSTPVPATPVPSTPVPPTPAPVTPVPPPTPVPLTPAPSTLAPPTPAPAGPTPPTPPSPPGVVINECDAAATRATCTDAGNQDCVDPVPSSDTLGDWQCVCWAGYTGVAVTGGAASCTNDPRDECAEAGNRETCAGEPGSECVDPTPTAGATRDWECRCAAGYSGTAMVMAAAVCKPDPLFECLDPVNRAACVDAGNQTCVDPTPTADKVGDWECRCEVGFTGTPGVTRPTMCAPDTLDECDDATNARTCADAGNQRCVDTNAVATALGDWQCVCADGYVGAPVNGGPAACVPGDNNECDDGTIAATCNNLGDQRCVDPTPTSDSTSDWECRCDDTHTGTPVVMGPAACEVPPLNECDVAANRAACTDAGNQDCVDPAPAADRVGDWECRCAVGYTGKPVLTAPAVCVHDALDECDDAVTRVTCTDAGYQYCFDTSAFADTLGDWECRCADGYVGDVVVGAPATCVPGDENECDDPSVRAVCDDARDQRCVDPTPTSDSTNDWECRCDTGYVGDAVVMAPAACEAIAVDECDVAATRAVCTGGGNQDCVDPNPLVPGTFTCVCAGGYLGATRKNAAATCVKGDLDECEDARAAGVCRGAGNQYCVDPVPTAGSEGDWVCRCATRYEGADVVRGAANCQLVVSAAAGTPLDECDAVCATCVGTTCSEHGQDCIDPEPTAGSVGDWECRCRLPMEGPGTRGAPTSCRIYAVREERKTINTINTVGRVVGLVAGSGTAVTASGRLKVVNMLNCEIDDIDLSADEPLDLDYHPFQAGVGPAAIQYVLGATLLNPVFIACFVALFGGITIAFTACRGMDIRDARTLTSMPGVLYVPYAFVLQGTTLAASRLLFHPDESGWWAVASGVVLFASLATVLAVWRGVLRHVDGRSQLVDDPRAVVAAEGDSIAAAGGKRTKTNSTSSSVSAESVSSAGDGADTDVDDEDVTPFTGVVRGIYVFAYGTQIVVSRSEYMYFVEHYGVIFDTLREKMAWAVMAELGSIVLVDLLAQWRPEDMLGCCVRNFSISFVLLLFFVLLAVFRPFLAAMDNVMNVALAGVVFAAVLCLSVALAVREDGEGVFTNVGSILLWISEVFVEVKICCDVLKALYDVVVGRKRAARRAQRKAAMAMADSMGRLPNFGQLGGGYDAAGDGAGGEPLLPKGSRGSAAGFGGHTFPGDTPPGHQQRGSTDSAGMPWGTMLGNSLGAGVGGGGGGANAQANAHPLQNNNNNNNNNDASAPPVPDSSYSSPISFARLGADGLPVRDDGGGVGGGGAAPSHPHSDGPHAPPGAVSAGGRDAGGGGGGVWGPPTGHGAMDPLAAIGDNNNNNNNNNSTPPPAAGAWGPPAAGYNDDGDMDPLACAAGDGPAAASPRQPPPGVGGAWGGPPSGYNEDGATGSPLTGGGPACPWKSPVNFGVLGVNGMPQVGGGADASSPTCPVGASPPPPPSQARGHPLPQDAGGAGWQSPVNFGNLGANGLPIVAAASPGASPAPLASRDFSGAAATAADFNTTTRSTSSPLAASASTPGAGWNPPSAGAAVSQQSVRTPMSPPFPRSPVRRGVSADDGNASGWKLPTFGRTGEKAKAQAQAQTQSPTRVKLAKQ